VTKANSASTLLKIDGMHCASCQRPIEKALRDTPGVSDVSVNLASREVNVDSTVSSDVLVAAIAGAGFEAVVDPIQSLEENDRANQANFRKLILKTALALGSGVLLMLYGMFSPAIESGWNLNHAAWLLIALLTSGVMYYTGRHFFIGAYQSLKTRSATMDTLIALGTGTAWLYSMVVVLAPGLGLTNRVIIDQHFNKRGRLGRLLAALSFNPFVCGLGIDENTAAFIAPDGVMEVVGHGTVTVVDPADLRHSSMSYVRKAEAVSLIGLKLHVLAHGSHFNLETREATLEKGS